MKDLIQRLRALAGYYPASTPHLSTPQKTFAEAASAIEAQQRRIGELRVALVEARRWIGDGELGDGLHRDHWTERYKAAVDLVDAALASKERT